MASTPPPPILAPPPPSFTGKAVATLVIYFFFWLPGLIANVIFLNEGKAAQRTYGQSLPGVGCLSVLLWVQVILGILGIMLAVGVCAALV